MSIEIKSFNQILGGMVRKIIAETPLSDVNPGSVFLSLLEACASQDFDNNVAILNILELLNVDSIRNSDLDNKAADFGLTRQIAAAASGIVKLLNTNITKQSSSLYSLKPAPISGQTVLYVNNTSGWSASGSLYIGRGTNSFEGPIPYTSITTFSTYSQITLGAALQKDHLSSDTVINAQGQPDRVIPAGTVVKIPANNQNPEILYNTIRDAVIPAGEDHLDGVVVTAQVAGSQGNALINTVKQFNSAPFVGAGVTNTTAFTSGADIETDIELRNRIKSYASSLARGTSPAILSAVIGLSDPDENKSVASAVLTQPVSVGDPSVLYIDDGSGFQPSQAGQPVDVLLAKANGTEEFLQLANYPVPRPQVINGANGPFAFVDQMFLRVAVDGTEETVVFNTSDFVNISVANLSEIVAAINSKSTIFKARLTNDSQNVLIYPVDPDAEIIQVIPLRDSDSESLYANNILNFPTKEVSYIALFQNSTRLHQRAKSATVETIAFASWNLSNSGDLIISVDGTPIQDVTFTLSDFSGVSSFSLLTLNDWVSAFNKKFAGISAISTPSQTMQISSNKQNDQASIEIIGGSYQAQMFASNPMSSSGQASQFEINRQTGNIRILTDISAGDVISAGVSDAKGFVVSTSTSNGTYNFDVDSAGRQSQLVICADASLCDNVPVNLTIDSTLTITDQGSSVMRIMAHDLSSFANVQPNHYIYIVYRSVGSSWVTVNNSGLFKILNKGSHLTAGTDSYIEVINNNISAQTVTVADISDIIAFRTDVYPQVWTTSYVPNPVTTSLNDLVDSIDSALQGVSASIFRSNSVKITSTTEDGGSIAIPVSVGSISSVIAATISVQPNNVPLIANKVSSKDMIGFLKVQPVKSQNTYLARAIYPSVWASLSATATPDSYPFSSAYSETVVSSLLTNNNVELSDLLAFTDGDNNKLLRSIAAKPASTSVGTQQGTPRTQLDFASGDSLEVFQSLKMSADDNIVVVMDQDATIKTIDINAARTGQINSGSKSQSFIPTSTEFSANDIDNEPGVDFSTVNVWGTDVNGTDFSDYRILMRARNWYATGGTISGGGVFIVRSAEYGLNGNLFHFSLQYPTNPNLPNTTVLTNTPSFNEFTYFFGSGADRATGIPSSTTVTITGPYTTVTEHFPAGSATTGDYYDLTWGSGTFTSVQVGDILSIFNGSGFDVEYLGQYGIKAISGNTIRIYNPSASAGSNTVSNPGLVHIFPLQNTTVAEIVTALNNSNILTAAAVSSGSLHITSSTFEDQYAYSTNATALAYGHNPTDSNLQGFIGLYDGLNYVSSFSNDNPNFTTKTTLTLNASGVSSSIYRMDTAPNEDGSIGEFIKLVPSTVKNIQHHFTQKALSQLPIVADVSIADDGKRVQIVSKQLGGEGAIQILGGNANQAQTAILDQTIVTADSSGSYLLGAISAFPNTYAQGDVIKIFNDRGVARQTQFSTSNTISVASVVGNRAEYYWDPVATNFVSSTTITITDVSSSYMDYNGNPIASGMVWRWTHSTSNTETLAHVVAGMQVIPHGTLTGWSRSNQAKLPGDGVVAGLPIIKVNDGSHYFDVLNPFGKVMSATAIGSSGVISICPTPRLRWNLAHSTQTPITSLSRTSNVITVQTSESHNMNTGDTAQIKDSLVLADSSFTITVTGPQTFTFSSTGSNFTEQNVGATTYKSTATPTSYRLENLGINNLVRLSQVSGDSPRFTDCGVAVDDYLVISGKTFNSLNNGTYRIVACDNASVTFEHDGAIDNKVHIAPFNNNSFTVGWTTNSNIVTGIAGSFKNLSNGLWVKKLEDDDSLYLQVTGNNTSDFSTATQIFLGGIYTGISGNAFGVSYNMTTASTGGVSLKSIDDIAVFEGDAAFKTDQLNVQNITDSSWFSPGNTGQFDIIEIGNNPSDYRPFVRVNNAIAVTEASKSLAAAVQGFYIIENSLYKYSSYRTIVNSAVSDTNNLQRNIYMAPDARAYKISQANNTFIQHVGKLGYDLNLSVGTDGYLFYTGLLRRCQRTIDGFAPDPATFPERRAVGSRIEILPPLVKEVTLILTVTTNDGFTIQDISDNIKSAIIDYVNGLGVGQDVILSAIIAAIMKVKGVAAATFNTPAPSEERITIATNEKALITADNIGIN